MPPVMCMPQAFRFDFLQEVDRIGLKDRHAGIGVESVKATGGVPRQACGQDRTLHQHNVAPSEFRQMVEHRRPDDASANNNDTIMRFMPGPLNRMANSFVLPKSSTNV